MAEENKEAAAAPVDLASIVKQLETIAPQVQQLMSFMEKLKPLEQAEHGASLDKEPEKDDGEGGEGTPAGSGMDERAFVARIAKRDVLAAKISKHVGTFDHASMTLDDVVTYGCDKLGIQPAANAEVRGAMLEGYLQAKPAATPAAIVQGMDAAAGSKGGNFVTKHLKGE